MVSQLSRMGRLVKRDFWSFPPTSSNLTVLSSRQTTGFVVKPWPLSSVVLCLDNRLLYPGIKFGLSFLCPSRWSPLIRCPVACGLLLREPSSAPVKGLCQLRALMFRVVRWYSIGCVFSMMCLRFVSNWSATLWAQGTEDVSPSDCK